MTVTGTTREVSSKTCVMPIFSPRIPLVTTAMSKLDLDVDPGRQVESHERVHRLRGGVEDVDHPLVRPHLEVLPRVLVLVRRPDDGKPLDPRGQRNRSVRL